MLNAKKTKKMVIDQNSNGGNDNFYVEGQQLEVVSSFDYLGLVINTNVDCSLGIRRRLGMARKVMMDLDNIWNSKISINLKLRLVETSFLGRHPWI